MTTPRHHRRVAIIALCVSALYFALPLAIQAAGGTPATDGLVPCGWGTLPPCQLCDIFVLLQNILNFIMFTLAPAIGVLMFIYAGIKVLLAAQNPAKISEGFNLMKTTAIGLLLIFGAYMFTNFVISLLADASGGKFVSWNTISCVNPTATDIPTSTPGIPGSGGGVGPTYDDKQEAALRASLIGQGVKLWPVCTVDQQSQCIILSGIRSDTLNEIAALNYACKNASHNKCELLVTGGTENLEHDPRGHSHQAGYKFDVDKGTSLALDQYIRDTYGPPKGQRASDGATVYLAPDGSIYADEGGHWDVCVSCGAPTLR